MIQDQHLFHRRSVVASLIALLMLAVVGLTMSVLVDIQVSAQPAATPTPTLDTDTGERLAEVIAPMIETSADLLFGITSSTAILGTGEASQWLESGLSYLIRGEIGRAISEYDRAIQIDPTSALAYYARGSAYLQIGDNQQAVEDLSRAIEIYPRFILAYYARASAYFAQFGYYSAIRDLDEVTRLAPDYAPAYALRGAIYVTLKDYELAQSDLDMAVWLNPTMPLAYFSRALLSLELENRQLALSEINMAISLDPAYAPAYAVRGRIHNSMGNSEAATADYRQYEQLTGRLESFMVDEINRAFVTPTVIASTTRELTPGMADGEVPLNGAERWIYDGRRGETITLRADAQDSGLRPVLTIISPDGFVMTRDRNRDGAGTSSLEQVTLPTNGRYEIVVGSLANESHGTYTLSFETEQSAAPTLPPVDEATKTAQLGENQGKVTAGSPDTWVYTGQAGDRITLTVEPTTYLDPVMLLLSPDGEILATTDGMLTPEIDGFELPVAGTYQIIVRGWDEQSSGEYTLFVGNDGSR